MATNTLAKKSDELAKQANQKITLTRERAQGFIERVGEAVEPFKKQQTDFTKKINALKIVDAESRTEASQLRRQVGDGYTQVSENLEQNISLANFLHKGLTTLRKTVDDLRKNNINLIDRRIAAYDDEVARKQAEADRKAREQALADEQEKKRKEEDEAAAKKKIADEESAKAQRLLDEAAELKRKADETGDLTLAVKAEQAEQAATGAKISADEATMEADTASFVAAQPIADVSHVRAAAIVDQDDLGETWVDNWKGECTNLEMLVRYVAGIPNDQPLAHPEYLSAIAPAESEINAFAAAQKSAMKVPGIRVYNAKFLRKKSR